MRNRMWQTLEDSTVAVGLQPEAVALGEPRAVELEMTRNREVRND